MKSQGISFQTKSGHPVIIVNFGLAHNLLLTTVNGLIIKHPVGDSIIVWSR